MYYELNPVCCRPQGATHPQHGPPQAIHPRYEHPTRLEGSFAARVEALYHTTFAQPVYHVVQPEPVAAPPPTSEAASEPPLTAISCQLSGGRCPGHFLLSPRSIKLGIIAHLHESHDGAAAAASAQECTWAGCVCGAPGARCGARGAGHAAHVHDLAEHVLRSHLGLRYACARCGRAQASTPFAQGRHGRACKGRVPVRCPTCLCEFDGEVALEGHMERCVG